MVNCIFEKEQWITLVCELLSCLGISEEILPRIKGKPKANFIKNTSPFK